MRSPRRFAPEDRNFKAVPGIRASMTHQEAWYDRPAPTRRQARRARGANGFLSTKCAEGFGWYLARSPRLGPISRRDIDPVSMRGFLQHVVLVDVERPQGPLVRRDDAASGLVFRFSLVGGHVDANYDERLKGRCLHELDLNLWRSYWLHAYAMPVRKRYPVTDRVKVVWRDREFMTLEYVLVPVVNDDDRIDRLLLIEEFSMSLGDLED